MQKLRNSFNPLKAALLAFSCLAMTFGGSAPAVAGGGYGAYGHARDYRPHVRPYRHYAPARYYNARRYRHGHRYRRGRISGGEAALIAAGIIGGVILINEAIEADRHRDYRRRYANRRYDERRFDERGPFEDEYYYRRDDRYDGGAWDERDRYGDRRYEDDWDEGFEDENFDDYRNDGDDAPDGAPLKRDDAGARDLDDELLGAEPARAAPRRSGYTIRAAYSECAAETRGAAGAGGLMVALPGEPTDVETLEGGAVRMTVAFTAQNPRGRSWRRVMVCEADGDGVRYLKIA